MVKNEQLNHLKISNLNKPLAQLIIEFPDRIKIRKIKYTKKVKESGNFMQA